MDKSISIIGATGRNSVAWTQAFLDVGFRVRNLVRDPSKFRPRLDLEYGAFDLDDRRTYRPALANTGLLALITPADPRQTEREIALIEAAERSGVQRILNLSVIGADLPEPISAFARWQAPVEKAPEGGATPYVTLRPNAFMQNLLLQKASIEAGRFIEPSESHRSSLIDVRDIAAFAVAMSAGGHDYRALDLTGPEALSGSEIAQVLSAPCGNPSRSARRPLRRSGPRCSTGAPLCGTSTLWWNCTRTSRTDAPHISRGRRPTSSV
jgi:uncharacterized protein YbjT (DUF2867 family)